MQALQVSTAIANEGVNQLQELKRIVVAQSNAQNSYMAYKASQDSYSEHSLEEVKDNMQTDFPPYKDNPELRIIPDMY